MLSSHYIQDLLRIKENHHVLNILSGRESHHLSAYFSSFSREERSIVRAVVIDM